MGGKARNRGQNVCGGGVASGNLTSVRFRATHLTRQNHMVFCACCCCSRSTASSSIFHFVVVARLCVRTITIHPADSRTHYAIGQHFGEMKEAEFRIRSHFCFHSRQLGSRKGVRNSMKSTSAAPPPTPALSICPYVASSSCCSGQITRQQEEEVKQENGVRLR